MFSIYQEYDDNFILDGVKYKRNASFDNILKIINLSNDKEFSGTTKILVGIKMLFGEDFPDDYAVDELNLILQSALEEYLESKEAIEYDDLGEPMPALRNGKKLMDIDYDAQAIYSSFMQAYAIDLHEQLGKMHWYQFKALLSGLPEKTRLRELIGYRGYEKPPKNETYDMRMMKLKHEHALPPEYSDGYDDLEDEFEYDDDEEVIGYGE